MNDVKLSLSVTLKGSVMESMQECIENPKKNNHNQLTVVNDKGKKEIIHFYTRGCKPAKQSIQMGKDAYDYMINKSGCPDWEKASYWRQMTKAQRLKSHLDRICQSLDGVSYTYEVFDD